MKRVKEAQWNKDELATFVHAHAKKRGRTYTLHWVSDPARTPATQVKAGAPFTVPLLGGGSLDFGAVLGKRVAVLVFWASWCGPCKVEAPYLQALYRRFSPKGVAFLAVSIDDADSRAELRSTVKRLGISYPVGLYPAGAVARKYNAQGSIPLTLVFTAEGDLIYQHGNFEPGDEVELTRVLDGLVSK